jgi:hypothetical protein
MVRLRTDRVTKYIYYIRNLSSEKRTTVVNTVNAKVKDNIESSESSIDVSRVLGRSSRRLKLAKCGESVLLRHSGAAK